MMKMLSVALVMSSPGHLPLRPPSSSFSSSCGRRGVSFHRAGWLRCVVWCTKCKLTITCAWCFSANSPSPSSTTDSSLASSSCSARWMHAFCAWCASRLRCCLLVGQELGVDFFFSDVIERLEALACDRSPHDLHDDGEPPSVETEKNEQEDVEGCPSVGVFIARSNDPVDGRRSHHHQREIDQAEEEPGDRDHAEADVVYSRGIVDLAAGLDDLEDLSRVEEYVAHVHAEHHQHADPEVTEDVGTVEKRQRHSVMHYHDGEVALLRVQEEVGVNAVQVPPDLQ